MSKPVTILTVLAITPSGSQGAALSFEELGAYLRSNCDTLAEKQRNERHCLRDELYRDGGVHYMESVLEKLFRDPEVRELRKRAIQHARFNNPLKRIVNEISTVYAEEAERHVTSGDENYQSLLELARFDEQMLQGSRLLNLHRAMLFAPRVRPKTDGTLELVIDNATPGNARAILHPNDPTMVVGWLIKATAKPARAQYASNVPAWTLWSDFERVQLREDMTPLVDTYYEHKLGLNPWTPVTLGPPAAGFWPGEEGEDLVAAHVAIWLSNILLLKEEKSATKQTVFTGDVARMAREQASDTESAIALPEGTNVNSYDMSMDLTLFTKTSDHILEHVAQNYGMSAALINQQGTQSAEARELMRIPLRELRKHQQIPLRRFERQFALALAAVARADLSAYSFDATGWRIKFGESQVPLLEKDKLDQFIAARAAGITDSIEFLMSEHDMSAEEARAALLKHIEIELWRNEQMRPLMAISGSQGAELAAANEIAAAQGKTVAIAADATGNESSTPASSAPPTK